MSIANRRFTDKYFRRFIKKSLCWIKSCEIVLPQMKYLPMKTIQIPERTHSHLAISAVREKKNIAEVAEAAIRKFLKLPAIKPTK